VKSGRFILLLAIPLAAALLAAGCTETFKLIWRSKKGPVEKKSFPAPNFRLAVVEWPEPSNPLVAVKVEQEKFWVEYKSQMRKQFKKFDSGKIEPVVPPNEQTRKVTAITGKTEWTPAPGVSVVFRVAGNNAETAQSTDDQGVARFDVSPFAEDWVEGKDLMVEVVAKLRAFPEGDAWGKVKGKHPRELSKLIKVEEKEVVEGVSVSQRTLEKIFDKR
jgi:hypothetical protein